MRLPLLSAHGAAVCVDVFVVLFDGAGEAVVAGGVGYEVIVIALRGMHRSFQRSFAGISDRAGREPGVNVGIVRGIESHVVVVQGSGVGSG